MMAPHRRLGYAGLAPVGSDTLAVEIVAVAVGTQSAAVAKVGHC